MFAKRNSIPNMFMLDSTGKEQNLNGVLNILSVAPHAVWGITSSFRLYVVEQEYLAFGSDHVPWTKVGNGYKFLDFSVPRKGFVVKTNETFCVRLGITENNPIGEDWSCQVSSETIQHLSCGVTGCFAIIGGILHFRQGITDSDPLGQV
ncbi:Hypothetical predicted protein [Paramuricea clavata]|uniref:Uncharacterized protein n=1 Tax=Paramuricea clavata TaxID=317549 RepID=A0A7D9EC10_PARCT|nr:Hypothetical predicted protein [Paramuricea clavata]